MMDILRMHQLVGMLHDEHDDHDDLRAKTSYPIKSMAYNIHYIMCVELKSGRWKKVQTEK